MKLDKDSLFRFSESIPARVEADSAKLVPDGPGTWDTRARRSFGRALVGWFCEEFGLSQQESQDYIFVEGSNAVPPRFRSTSFFSSKIYPDAALVFQNEAGVAIELDHGSKGSRIKNALAKAGFCVKLGGYDRALVLFFVDPPKSRDDFERTEKEEEILDLYEKHFQTKLYII